VCVGAFARVCMYRYIPLCVCIFFFFGMRVCVYEKCVVLLKVPGVCGYEGECVRV